MQPAVGDNKQNAESPDAYGLASTPLPFQEAHGFGFAPDAKAAAEEAFRDLEEDPIVIDPQTDTTSKAARTPISARSLAIVCAALLAAFTLGGIIFSVVTSDSTAGDPGQVITIEYERHLVVSLENWDPEESSSLVAHVKGEKADNFYLVQPDTDFKVMLAPGTYELSFISPLNADGSAYDVSQPRTLEVNEADLAQPLEVSLDYIEAKDVTNEFREDVYASLLEIGNRGKGALTTERQDLIASRVEEIVDAHKGKGNDNKAKQSSIVVSTRDYERPSEGNSDKQDEPTNETPSTPQPDPSTEPEQPEPPAESPEPQPEPIDDNPVEDGAESEE